MFPPMIVPFGPGGRRDWINAVLIQDTVAALCFSCMVAREHPLLSLEGWEYGGGYMLQGNKWCPHLRDCTGLIPTQF
jgi:hypothetical protein